MLKNQIFQTNNNKMKNQTLLDVHMLDSGNRK